MTSDAMINKSLRLREAFAGDRLLRAAGAHNGLTAKLAEVNGFDAVWASSFELSASHALPDVSLLTMSDYLYAVCSMNRACGLPVIADCDTGFGGVLNVAYMAQLYEEAGIAAVCIEDKTFPKVNSFVEHQQELVDPKEFARKLEVAKAAASDNKFFVIARTEALIAGAGLDEALRRARTYASAGANAILVHSRSRSPSEILQFMERWDNEVPVVVVPTTYYTLTVEHMQRIGIRMAIYANHGLRASVKAINETLAAVHSSGSSAGVEDQITPLQQIFELQDLDRWLKFER